MDTENLRKFLQTKPENLAEQQHIMLKEFVVERLQKIIDLIDKEEYVDVLKMTAFSPAGDGYGQDNSYIDFSDVFGVEADIEVVIEKLQQLKSQSF